MTSLGRCYHGIQIISLNSILSTSPSSGHTLKWCTHAFREVALFQLINNPCNQLIFCWFLSHMSSIPKSMLTKSRTADRDKTHTIGRCVRGAGGPSMCTPLTWFPYPRFAKIVAFKYRRWCFSGTHLRMVWQNKKNKIK